MRSSQRGRELSKSFQKAMKSFQGHLEGTSKSMHTIDSYRLDLSHFQKFLGEQIKLSDLTRKDLERYHDHMKSEGHKTNTRRRRIMTVRKFMAYVTKRSKLEIDVAKKLPAPEKIERVPHYVSTSDLVKKIQSLNTDSLIFARNRALLWVLAETGCQVSEITRLAWREIDFKKNEVEFLGQAKRVVSISAALSSALAKIKNENETFCFLGFNRFGSLGAPITPRGVELLVKSYESKLGLGLLTPRTFRHSVVVHWFIEGVSEKEIQRRLGLRTPYAFRVYAPIFNGLRSTNEATSSE
jgi:site-specific recombinase XerD